MLYQRVAYIDPQSVTPIAPQSTGGGSLGAGLFTTIRSFTYNTYGGNLGIYNVTRQGLVALMAMDPVSPYGNYKDAGYRIFTKADGTMDPLPLMEAMAAICGYGSEDEALSHSNRLLTAKARPLEMRCGPTTEFVLACAAGVGVTARRMHCLNVSNPNNFDDGHVFCEAMVSGTWRLFDVPNDRAWTDSNGNQLSLAEVCAARPINCLPLVLAQPRVGRATYGTGSCWISAFYEMQLRTPQLTTDWCERIYEVPGIGLANGGIEFGLPPHLTSYKSYIENFPGTGGLWTTRPLADWVAAHY